MPPSPRVHAFSIVIAGMLACLSAGSLYAWSLFYAPIERDLGIGRTWLAGAFSLAGILFAAAMMIAPIVFRGRAASWLLLLSSVMCGAGMIVPGFVREVWCIVLFTGAVFGTGAGIGYAVALQAIMLAMPHRRGLGAGLMASAGALGSILGAVGFRVAIEAWGPWHALMAGGGVLFACTAAAAILLIGLRMARPAKRAASDATESRLERRIEVTFWLGFFFGACAGLMALGHAAGLALAIGGPLAPVALATALVTGANGIGRLGAGALAGLLPARRILLVAPLLAAAALASLAIAPSTALALVVLTVTGFAYGAIASTYPAAVAIYFGIERTGIIFGRVFTAWGATSLLAPGLGGYLFDATGTYASALTLAAGAGLVSAAVAATLPPPHR